MCLKETCLWLWFLLAIKYGFLGNPSFPSFPLATRPRTFLPILQTSNLWTGLWASPTPITLPMKIATYNLFSFLYLLPWYRPSWVYGQYEVFHGWYRQILVHNHLLLSSYWPTTLSYISSPHITPVLGLRLSSSNVKGMPPVDPGWAPSPSST